jgi:mono/diheme cytochrome c family protein
MRGLVKLMLVALPIACVVMVAAAQEKPGGNSEAAKLKNPVAATPESIAAGEAVYMRRCRGCHGKDGKGGPPKEAGERAASNLVDDQWDHGGSDGEIFFTIRNGVPPRFLMEPWDDRLSETDTWNVVNFLRSLAKQ